MCQPRWNKGKMVHSWRVSCVPQLAIMAVVMTLYSALLLHSTRRVRLLPKILDGSANAGGAGAAAPPKRRTPCDCGREALMSAQRGESIVLSLSKPYRYFEANHWFHIGEYYVPRHAAVVDFLPKNGTLYILAPSDVFVDKLVIMTFFLLLLAFTDETTRHVEVLSHGTFLSHVSRDILALERGGAANGYVYDASLPPLERIWRGGTAGNLINLAEKKREEEKYLPLAAGRRLFAPTISSEEEERASELVSEALLFYGAKDEEYDAATELERLWRSSDLEGAAGASLHVKEAAAAAEAAASAAKAAAAQKGSSGNGLLRDSGPAPAPLETVGGNATIGYVGLNRRTFQSETRREKRSVSSVELPLWSVSGATHVEQSQSQKGRKRGRREEEISHISAAFSETGLPEEADASCARRALRAVAARLGFVKAGPAVPPSFRGRRGSAETLGTFAENSGSETLSGLGETSVAPACVCARYVGEYASAPVERGFWFGDEAAVANARGRIDALCGNMYRKRRRSTRGLGSQKTHVSPHKLVIYQRDYSRRLVNEEGVRSSLQAQLGASWTVEVVVHSENHHPCQLFDLLADADVLLTPHGFQSMLLLFLPPGAALFEVFPYKYWKEGYAPLAAEWGISYHFVMSRSLQMFRGLLLFFVPQDACMRNIYCRKFSRADDVRLEEQHLKSIARTARRAAAARKPYLEA